MMLSASALLLALCGTASAFCGVREPSAEGLAILSEFHNQESTVSPDDFLRGERPSNINVYVHVIRHSATESTLAREVDEQIDVLNEVFEGTQFTFRLAGYDSPVYPDLAPVSQGSAAEELVKELRRGDASDLNLYIVPEIGDGIAGYATFPWDYLRSSQQDGVVILRTCVPGGNQPARNTGKVAGHEVGHWLGLLHTFQGGCQLGGDFIDDTPAEESPADGCPTGRDSCPGGGVDPIHNHMDYSDDDCRTEFTPRQIQRMATAASVFRRL
ncbi:zinc metalloprotease [Aspergillus lucknowensis]|uniref:Peptidase M43 pregnancy-associated plasma-A domain-containing protein n=1 Tax=Aspergillus lucknowensis TaxID=176173 RepID=A0ABR4LU25_9EURO